MRGASNRRKRDGVPLALSFAAGACGLWIAGCSKSGPEQALPVRPVASNDVVARLEAVATNPPAVLKVYVPDFGATEKRPEHAAPERIGRIAKEHHQSSKHADRYPVLAFCQGSLAIQGWDGQRVVPLRGYEAKFTKQSGDRAGVTYYFDEEGRYLGSGNVICDSL